MQESTEKFYRKCRIKGLTTGTIDGYRYSLSTFQQFYQGNLDELAQDDIDEYAEHLLDTYTNITTVNNKLRDLRVFLRSLQGKGSAVPHTYLNPFFDNLFYHICPFFPEGIFEGSQGIFDKPGNFAVSCFQTSFLQSGNQPLLGYIGFL